MAFDYNCDFYLQAQRLTPITKRQEVRLGVLECISESLQWNRDNFFESFLEGDNSALWVPATAYSRYERVNYQNKIYECTNDNTGELPSNTDYWVLVVNDFRGAKERIKYNCQTIILEYILNKWFGTVFRQPSTGLNSDFYIVNNSRETDTFTVAEFSYINEVFATSEVPEFHSLSEWFIGETPDYLIGANFTVFYPIGVIDSTENDKYFQMMALINKYKIFGSTVEYTSY